MLFSAMIALFHHPTNSAQELMYLPMLLSICFLVLATPWSMQGLSSPPQRLNPAPFLKHGVLTTRLPGFFSDSSYPNGVRTHCGFDLHF